MDSKLVYIPVFKGLQEELKVLRTFDFGDRIYPCLEIIKELDRLPPTPKKPRILVKPQKLKSFEDVYVPLIRSIKAMKVFVDLPVQIKEHRNMNDETLMFLRTVVAVRDKRTEYLKKLSLLKDKVVPIITSYYERTNERNSILLQESDLRNIFDSLAFRTTYDNLSRDIVQISTIARSNDYLIVDCDGIDIHCSEDENSEFIEKIAKLNCTIIIHRNPIPQTVTNSGLDHGKAVENVDNSLLQVYKDLGGNCFSDYGGIKKHSLNKGGSISPGFIYYDATTNIFYGFKSTNKVLVEFERIIVPAIISSSATQRMQSHKIDFLGNDNLGWTIINRIQKRDESGQNAGKFKRVGLEHYLHCLKLKIAAGEFD